MIIPLKFPDFASYGALPSNLATLGSGEVVLIELQGFLEVDGERLGETIGTLGLEDPVSPFTGTMRCVYNWHIFSLYRTVRR